MTAPDEQEIDISLRSPEEVGARIVVLGALCRRLFLDDPAAVEALEEDPETERWDLNAWLDERGLSAVVTPEERRLLERPVGRLTPEERVKGPWLGEALMALAWAASLVDALPPPAEPADVAPLLALIPAPWDELRSFIDRLRLRSEEEIAFERERAEVWAWRAGIEMERRTAQGQAARELQAVIEEVVHEAVASGVLPPATPTDFPVDHFPFSALPTEQVEQVALIASARLHALNWLCGFGETWDSVPLEI